MFKFFVVAATAADDEFVVHRSPKALEAGMLANALGAPEPTNRRSQWQSSAQSVKLLVDYLVEAFGQRHADDTVWKRAGVATSDDNAVYHLAEALA